MNSRFYPGLEIVIETKGTKKLRKEKKKRVNC